MNNLTYLVDICDFQGGTQPPKKQWSKFLKDGYIRMLQIRDFTQFEKVEPEYVKYSTKLKTCKSDDILIARYGASLGKILTGLSGAYNVAIMKTIPNENKITKKYLYYYFLSDSFQNTIKNFGSRAAQAGFNKEDLSLIKLKCPSIEKQEEQCLVLNYIYNLIDKRRRQILLLDKLVKSRFIEMFGDPVTNSYNLPIVSLGELSELITKGASPSWQGFSYIDDRTQTLFITSENVREGYIDLSFPKYIEDGFNDKQKRSVIHKGDFLINIVGASIGRAAQFNLDCKANMNQAAALVRINDKRIKDNYLLIYLNSEKAQRMYDLMKSDTGRANLSLKDISDLSILLPPIAQQEKFEKFFTLTNKSKFVNYKCLQTAANIYRQEWMRCQTSNF